MHGVTVVASIALTFAFVRCGTGGGTGGGGSATVDLDQDGYNAAVDCDDNDAAVHPGAADVCNFKDDDCDGVSDEDAPPVQAWHDKDGDGFGDAIAMPFAVCALGSNQVTNADDCDDTNKDINPLAKDVCNYIDDDCDRFVDEDIPPTRVWLDDDGDGYGDSTGTAFSVCVPSSSQVTNNDDCDDTDAAINPLAKDVCNYIDDDCDRFVDEDIPPTRVWLDDDGDGYGDSTGTGCSACGPSAWLAADNDDCDDSNKDINPLAKDVCNYIDDDCDRFVDEDVPPTRVWHDKDGDGYGDSTGTAFSVCVPSSSQVTNDDDCDDSNKDINPLAKDVCNYIDDDCDRFVDEDIPPTRVWPDDDGDSYGDMFARSYKTCTVPTGWVASGTDCDDTRSGVSPATTEVCGNGLDDDCDGDTDLADSDCEKTYCGSITTSQTWATTHRHRITCDTTVTSKAVLTLADGIVVEFDTGTTLSVGTTGEGAIQTGPVSKGVLLTSSASTPKAGDFAGLVIGSKDTGSAFAGLTLEYGGSKGACMRFVDLPGTSWSISDFTVKDCKSDGIEIENSDVDLGDVTSTGHGGDALVLDDDVVLSGFSGLTLTGNGGVPLVVPVSQVPALDLSTKYTGNTDDVVEVLGGTIDSGQTWSKLPVPYRVLSTITVSSTSTYTAYLDVSSSMTIGFDSGAGLVVGPTSSGYGSLYAYDEGLGGPTFTSSASTKTAGDWEGITLGPGDEGSGISGVVVEYGGGNGKGNLWYQTTTSSITTSTIRHSSTYGIYRDTGKTPYIWSISYSSNTAGDLR